MINEHPHRSSDDAIFHALMGMEYHLIALEEMDIQKLVAYREEDDNGNPVRVTFFLSHLDDRLKKLYKRVFEEIQGREGMKPFMGASEEEET